MEALVIYLVLVASVFASAALSWWVGYQMGREEGAAPSVDDLEALYGPPPPRLRPPRSCRCPETWGAPLAESSSGGAGITK